MFQNAVRAAMRFMAVQGAEIGSGDGGRSSRRWAVKGEVRFARHILFRQWEDRRSCREADGNRTGYRGRSAAGCAAHDAQAATMIIILGGGTIFRHALQPEGTDGLPEITRKRRFRRELARTEKAKEARQQHDGHDPLDHAKPPCTEFEEPPLSHNFILGERIHARREPNGSTPSQPATCRVYHMGGRTRGSRARTPAGREFAFCYGTAQPERELGQFSPYRNPAKSAS